MTNEYIKNLEEEFLNKLKMGDVYQERGKHEEAVSHLKVALELLLSLCILFNERLRNASNDSSNRCQIGSILRLTMVFSRMLESYSHIESSRLKILFLVWVFKKSLDRVDRLGSYFDADSLETYEGQKENLDNLLQTTRSGVTVESLLDEISTLSFSKETVVEIDEGDYRFASIREHIYRICALESCYVDIPRPNSSDFWERRKDKLLENLNLPALGAYLGISIFGFYIGWSWVGWFFTALASLAIFIWSN
jgi:hypothetical protein